MTGEARGERSLAEVSPTVGMAFLSAVFAKPWRAAVINLNGTSLYEMLRLLDQIDRKDLADLILVASSLAWAVNVPKILFAISNAQGTRSVPLALLEQVKMPACGCSVLSSLSWPAWRVPRQIGSIRITPETTVCTPARAV